MNRNEFMELVYETFADEPDNVLANGIIEAADAYVEHEKAQLSQEGTTSDLISRTETVKRLRRMLEATVPNTDYDEGYIDGIEFGISTVSTMPTIQPQSTTGQPNDGVRSTARSTDLIDRQQTLDALIGAVKKVGILDADDIKAVFDMLPTIQPIATDTNVGNNSEIPNSSDCISRQWLLDCINDGWIKFDTDKDANRFIHLVRDIAPTIQPERKKGRFERKQDGVFCSVCHYGWEFITGVPAEVEREYHYCPNCGADMRGEKDV